MPWLETDVREQRIAFVVEALQPAVNRSALCRKRGIQPEDRRQVARVLCRRRVAERPGRAVAPPDPQSGADRGARHRPRGGLAAGLRLGRPQAAAAARGRRPRAVAGNH